MFSLKSSIESVMVRCTVFVITAASSWINPTRYFLGTKSIFRYLELVWTIFRSIELWSVPWFVCSVDADCRSHLVLRATADISPQLPLLLQRFVGVTKLVLKCERQSTSIDNAALLSIALHCPQLKKLKLKNCKQVRCCETSSISAQEAFKYSWIVTAAWKKDSQPEPKLEPTVDLLYQNQNLPRNQNPIVHPELKPEPDADLEFELVFEPDAESELNPEPEPEAEPEPEPEPDPGPEFELF